MGKLVGISAALLIVLIVNMSLLLEAEGASGSTEVELSTDCTREYYTQCIEQENTNDSVELGNDLTVNMTARLPNLALSYVLFNQSNLAVVSITLDVIRGREILDQGYMDRLDVNWSVESSRDDYGLLKLSLLLQRAEYADTRLLHVEIRTKNVLYKTKGKKWFHVPGSDIRDTQTVPSDVEATQSDGMDLGATTPTYRDHGNDTFKDNLIDTCQEKSSTEVKAILIIVIIILCRTCGFKPIMLFVKMVMHKLRWTWLWGDPNCSSVTVRPLVNKSNNLLHVIVHLVKTQTEFGGSMANGLQDNEANNIIEMKVM